MQSRVDAYEPQNDEELEDVLGSPEGNGTKPHPANEPGLPSFVRLSEVAPDIAIEWDAEDLFVHGEPAVLAGRGATYKTSTILAMAGAVATGHRVFGRFHVPTPGPFCYVSGEDPPEVIRNRLEAICHGHGYNVADAFENVHVLALSGIDLAEERWRRHVRDEVRAIGARMLVLDPLAEVDSGEENNNDDRRRLVRAIRWFGAETDATVLVAHHFRKSAEGGDKGDLIRGGNALPNASRQTYALERLDDGSVTVECVKFSRAARRPPFVLRPIIETKPGNEAVWLSARFEYATASEAKFDRAEEFVLERLTLGVRLSTSDLKLEAKGTGVSGADIARALRVLEMRRLISFEAGEKNAKLWGLVAGQAGQPENVLARQTGSLPGNQNKAGSACLAPFRGASRNRPPNEHRQPDPPPNHGEAWEPPLDDSQAAMWGGA